MRASSWGLEEKRSAAAQNASQWLAGAIGSLAADYVILDLPPANVDPASRLLAGAADRTLVVVRGGVTPRAELQRVLFHLEDATVSVVVNGAARRVPSWLDRVVSALRSNSL